MACTLIQYRKLHRAFLLVLIEDRGPHVDLFLKHQVLICLARCLGLFQGLASTTVSTHCHCHILLLASKLRISAKKNIEKVWYQYGSHQYLCNKPRTLHPLDLYKFREFFLAIYLQVNFSKSFLFLSSPILWNSRDWPLSCLVKFSICLLN